MLINFHNTYAKLPPRFYEKNLPASFPNPQLIMFNAELAVELGIDVGDSSLAELAKIFSGQTILAGAEPLSQAYAGFQFGHPSPQLGDGRAHLLGEVNGFDIQLKGSGPSKFSRRGDGLSALGPVIREYIVSEALHHLNVPTTRALAAVSTGQTVWRQSGFEPGGIFTRVASSHIRVGTFQYFAFKQDIEALEILLDYTLKHHYPGLKAPSQAERCLLFLKHLARRQANLVADWTSLGFIHGVMNTDNCSAVGLTLDYGPCAFLDAFSYQKIFSSIDEQGRYSFFNQVPIAQWNVLRLADSLLPLMHPDETKAVAMVKENIQSEMEYFINARWQKLAKKIGIDDFEENDKQLVTNFLNYLEKEGLDFTLAFRYLPELFEAKSSFYPYTSDLKSFLIDWKKRVNDVKHLNQINPLYIPRNHQVERAIKECYRGNDKVFKEMVELLKKPFTVNKSLDHFKTPPTSKERVSQTFCGT